MSLNKWRKVLLITISTIFLFSSGTIIADAWSTGAQGGGGGSTGSLDVQYPTAGTDNFTPGAYRFDLVYRPQGGDYSSLQCAVVYTGRYYEELRAYASDNGCTFLSDESNLLVGLGIQLKTKKLHLDDWTTEENEDARKYFAQFGIYINNGTIEDKEAARNFFNQFGANINNYRKPGSEPGNINSYGYRILIQEIKCFGYSGDGWCSQVRTRKEAAASSQSYNLFGGKYTGDLYTTHDDIGIYDSRLSGDNPWEDYKFGGKYVSIFPGNPLYDKFADWHDGTGFNIIGFNPEIFKAYDYSIDAACEDCSSKTKKGSYQIQDTNDWEAILASAESENSNAKNYYKKNVGGGCQVYCREEFNVVFPNENNKIHAESGRYFTVNKQSTGVMIGSGVSNFKPIKVNKTRQCRATGSNQRECLQNFVNNNTGKDSKYTYPAAGHSGSITLTYKEKKYDITVNLEENVARTVTNDEITENHIDNSDYILTSTSTKWFELPKDTYRYVGSDGLSYSKKPTDNKFTDTGTENLPISFENDAEGASISLKYGLPKHDGNSKMYEAFNANNDYFGTKNNNEANIYNKEKNNKLENNEPELIRGSACAKLYGYGTSKYYACRNERIINKAGKCYSKITEGKYTCEVNTCPKGEKLCDNGECSTDGGKCSTKNPKCKIVGQKYYDASGNEVTKEKYESQCGCSIRNGQYYDENNNVIDEKTYMNVCPTNKCTVVTGKSGDKYYYNYGGKLVTKEEYDKDYNANCKKEVDYCKACNGGVCCPDTDMVCPDENGNCPVPGGKKIIYRTIDLDNPFPSLTGLGRKTGANWCSYNINTKKISCANTGTVASGNAIVYKHILNNRNTQSKSVYSAAPLYEVKLDSKTISAVKSYNRSHEYDDFELTCNKKTCKSNGFLRGVVNITQGKCKSGSMSNLESCAEVKG